MSKTGDIVWADGKSWQRDDEHASGFKEWWIAPKNNPSTLKVLKEYNDFRWLVKNGKPADNVYYENKPNAWETAKFIAIVTFLRECGSSASYPY